LFFAFGHPLFELPERTDDTDESNDISDDNTNEEPYFECVEDMVVAFNINKFLADKGRDIHGGWEEVLRVMLCDPSDCKQAHEILEMDIFTTEASSQ
jgi:hypothetical protein